MSITIKTYPTREKAAAAWLRSAKKQDGVVTVLGGGWWKIAGLGRKPIQGFGPLGYKLWSKGSILQSGNQWAVAVPPAVLLLQVAEPIAKLAARVARADARLEAALIDTWRTDVVARAAALDAENDKGGHDWHSLWTGFCIGIRRPDLTSYEHYMKLGFPVEQEPQKV